MTGVSIWGRFHRRGRIGPKTEKQRAFWGICNFRVSRERLGAQTDGRGKVWELARVSTRGLVCKTQTDLFEVKIVET